MLNVKKLVKNIENKMLLHTAAINILGETPSLNSHSAIFQSGNWPTDPYWYSNQIYIC